MKPPIVLVWVLATASAACTSSATTSITNGANQNKLTTFWTSAGNAGCIVGLSGFCFGPLNFALADDGTAVWSSNYGCCGTSTWLKVGDGSTIILSDQPLSSGGLNISNIVGSRDQGTFTGDATGYHNIEFTLGVGPVPNACMQSVVGPSGTNCAQP